ncbi:hypothetical protein T10_9973 [Trichinella papuae]|uniref:Uncharacterized protein n=1 Tax=Trichinella papuae TaxID=268474 RepID=A0A0V1MJQ9_9BILA|nr:hypothetical protein T10_9973 [Trichinella papuae]
MCLCTIAVATASHLPKFSAGIGCPVLRARAPERHCQVLQSVTQACMLSFAKLIMITAWSAAVSAKSIKPLEVLRRRLLRIVGLYKSLQYLDGFPLTLSEIVLNGLASLATGL